jgi:sugar/nucleoside kinase (ribokinase family)
VSKILVIGDVMDDIIVVTQDQIRTNTDTTAEISHTFGGSAGNIASWAANNGASVCFVGCVNEHDALRIKNQFEQYSVQVNLQHDKHATGTLVSIVEGANRTMLTDRGANKFLDFEALSNHFLSEYDFVFISGYALFGRSVSEIQNFISRVTSLNAKVLVDPGSVGFINDYGKEDFIKALHGIDILLPNEQEFEILGTSFPVVIVTKGNQGVDLYVDGQLTESFEVEKLDAIDPTGAGDSFSGALVASLARGDSYHNAVTAGIKSAAKAVMTIGARPQL